MATPTRLASPRPLVAGRWRRFARAHGWRAYALPVLTVLTVVAAWLAAGPAGTGRANQVAASPWVASSSVASSSVATATADVTTTTTTTTTVGVTAEVSAAVKMPIGVVRVLLGDLVEQGYVGVQATLDDSSSRDERLDLLERTLRGLRAF